MIEGRIDPVAGPRIRVRVSGSRERVWVDALLDTGFDGDLCLPIAVGVSLGLELRFVTRSELADGSVIEGELETEINGQTVYCVFRDLLLAENNFWRAYDL